VACYQKGDRGQTNGFKSSLADYRMVPKLANQRTCPSIWQARWQLRPLSAIFRGVLPRLVTLQARPSTINDDQGTLGHPLFTLNSCQTIDLGMREQQNRVQFVREARLAIVSALA
jgi:hypothetical protein